ncbi:MAG: serine/threonine protein kinase [Myxococcales bacterium]|nr:serine/threonine protein kinase [Myxococcales bacterium]
MGEVWAARDLAAPGRRIVAVKMTKQEGVEAAKVLWDEARIASLIQHPNVCPVYEMGHADGVQYLVMDWCDGASLHDLLQKIPGQTLPLPIAVKIAAQVAAGLHAAHELVDEAGQALGVVHRDVSPQNVLISSQGAVLVTDFGVAKAAGQAHRPTETGEVKGKLSYMAPEQVKSKDVDRRADVFSLGCLLYLTTVGRRPFHGDDALATLYQILEKDVERPRALREDYPEALDAIVMKALAKDREERFQTAEELQIALESWLVETRTRVTEQDIARLLLEQLGETIRERKGMIAERDRHAEQLERGDVAAAPPREERSAERQSSSFAASVVTPNATPTPAARAGDTKPAPGRTIWTGAGVAAALALGVAIVARLQGGELQDAALASGEQRAAAQASSDAPGAAPADATVAVRVSVSPATAEILLDGTVVGRGSYTAEVARAERVRVLEARLEGHRAVTRSVTFDRSQDVHFELMPLGAAGEARSADGATSVRLRPASTRTNASPQAKQPSAARPPTTAAQDPMALPRPKPKVPRPIDATNPFEDPG